MTCPKCGNPAAAGAFCTLCGTSLLAPPALAQTAMAMPPPPNPYAVPVHAPYMQQQPSVALVPMHPMAIVPFRCMACGYTGQSMIVRKISTAGWITFGVLMLAFFPLFWIGLLIRETRVQCPNCRMLY